VICAEEHGCNSSMWKPREQASVKFMRMRGKLARLCAILISQCLPMPARHHDRENPAATTEFICPPVFTSVRRHWKGGVGDITCARIISVRGGQTSTAIPHHLRLPPKRAWEPMSIAHIVYCAALPVFASNTAYTVRRQQAIIDPFVQTSAACNQSLTPCH
jgi:hypothetical protein